MDIIIDKKLTDMLNVKCIKSVTIKNWYCSYDKGKEYLEGHIYRCNNSTNEIRNIYRVFVKSNYPIYVPNLMRKVLKNILS